MCFYDFIRYLKSVILFFRMFFCTILIFFPIFCFYKYIKTYSINYFVLERYTSKTDISAGETPEIREACPIEIGLYASSF